MTNAELKKLLEKTKLKVAYHHFLNPVEPPLIVFCREDDDNLSADDKVYFKSKNYRVELYTKEKNPTLEETLENIFDDANIFYEASEVWIDSEKVYMIIYLIQI